MPNNQNARKAMRQNEKRRLRNRSARSALRTLLKKFRLTAAEGDVTATEAAFRTVCKHLDQAAAKKLIHANASARTKSRLSRLVRPQAPVAATAEGQ
jgi:small subunit ribosomal protein S20